MGAEHSISLSSAAGIIRSLEKCGVPVIKIGIRRDGDWFIFRGSTDLIPNGEWERADIVPAYPVRILGECGFFACGEILSVRAAIIALHGDFGEDGTVQGALRTAGIPYAGCGVCAGAICADKAICKMLAEYSGVPTVPWVLYTKCDVGAPCGYGNVCRDKRLAISEAQRKFGFPMFVKPAGLGSSIGASCAMNAEELSLAIDKAAAEGDGRVLIERHIDILCELECAYLEMDGRAIYTSAGSILADGGFYDFKTKYEALKKVKVDDSAEICSDVGQRLQDYCKRLVAVTGIRQLARIDFFLSKDKDVYFNEINTFPGMTESSLYPRLVAKAGVDFDKLAISLTDGACL
jgi:D-alanine--D-alanine ligase